MVKRNSMIKGCIFDLDGVIVDTAKYHFKAWERLASSLSIPFTEQDNEHLKGVSRLESLKFILSLGDVTLSEEETSKLLRLKNDWYIDLISDLSSLDLLEGIPEFLEHLKSEHIKISLGSASKNAMPVLVSTGILPYFDYISDGNSTDKSKPDPEVFYIAAQGLGLEPSECIVFEDAIKGIEAALNGGFKVVGIGEKDVLDMAHVVYPNLVGKTFKNIIKDLTQVN